MMGADLIVAWCDYPDVEDAAIAALPDDKLAACYEEWQGEKPDDDTDWRQDTRDRVSEAFKNLGRRDISDLHVHGHHILIGGGTSSGDTPEGYIDVLLIALSGIGQEKDEEEGECWRCGLHVTSRVEKIWLDSKLRNDCPESEDGAPHEVDAPEES